MILKIPSDQRIARDLGWLQARWLFSFGDHHDPNNLNWGALRVFNDDVIQPGGGFGMHPHQNMEIITVVLEGALEHRDSMGHHGIIRPNDVQVMSAGSGVRHSEFNPSEEHATHLFQIWIAPRTRHTAPSYAHQTFDPEEQHNRLQWVIGKDSTLRVDQDVSIALTNLDAGQSIQLNLTPERYGFIYVIEGAVQVGSETLEARDQGRIHQESELTLAAQTPTKLIVLDLPEMPEA